MIDQEYIDSEKKWRKKIAKEEVEERKLERKRIEAWRIACQKKVKEWAKWQKKITKTILLNHKRKLIELDSITESEIEKEVEFWIEYLSFKK